MPSVRVQPGTVAETATPGRAAGPWLVTATVAVTGSGPEKVASTASVTSRPVLGPRAAPGVPPTADDAAHADGAALSRQARDFWRERWAGKSLMVMRALHADIHNCPPPIEIFEGGHFVQEWGEPIAEAAVSLMKI